MYTIQTKIEYLLLKASGPVFVLLLWYIANKLSLVDTLYLPEISRTFYHLVQDLSSQVWLLSILSTLVRTLSGFLVGSLLAIPAGLILGYSTKLYSVFEFLIDFFRSIPSTSFLPLFLLAFGFGDGSKIMLSGFVSFLLVLINTIHGVWNSPKTRLKVAKTFGCSTLRIFKEVLFFDSLPQIFVGLRTAFSVSLVIMIVSEMFIGTTYGIGKSLYESYTTYKTPRLFSQIIVTGLLGYFLNKSILFAEKKIVHWVEK